MNTTFGSEKSTLHIKAEQLLTDISEQMGSGFSNASLELLRDLQLHQAELEMQNETLRQACLALEETNNRYVEFYNCAPVACLTVTAQGLIEKANFAGAALLGVEQHHLLQKEFSVFVSPTDAERWQLFFAQLLQQKQQQTIELSLESFNGVAFYARLACSLIADDGRLASHIALTDITKLKQAEQALFGDEAYRSILATSLDGFWVISPQGKLLDVNQRYVEQSGYSREELLKMSVSNLEVIESKEDIAAHIQKIIKNGGDQFESMHRRKNGTFWHVEVSVSYRNFNGGIFYAFLRDITERKQIEMEKEQFFSFFNLAPDFQCIAGIDGFFKKVNPTFMEVLGFTEQEFLSQPFLEFIHPEDRQPMTEEMKKQLQQQEKTTFSFENRYVCKNGSFRWLSWRAVFSRNNGLIYAIAHDITNRKHQEAEIKRLSDSELNKAKLEAEKANQVKTEFLSSMSHELRTPMNAVLGFAQLLRDDDLTEDQHDSVNEILAAGYHLLDLINDVLDLSRIESENLELTLEKIDLKTLVLQSLTLTRPLALKNSIKVIDNTCKECDFTPVGDSLRLKQVLLNLLSNAIKYNRVGGTIILSCEISNPQTGRINVIDSGKGLSGLQISQLFQPFERLGAKNSAIEGTGIGLCISKKLIEAMNGTIGVTSVLGEGSCFWVEIPLA